MAKLAADGLCRWHRGLFRVGYPLTCSVLRAGSNTIKGRGKTLWKLNIFVDYALALWKLIKLFIWCSVLVEDHRHERLVEGSILHRFQFTRYIGEWIGRVTT